MADRELDRARTLARVLDDYLLDPLLGLVLPGVGDVIGSVLGLYIVGVALRRRASPVVIARMVMNLGLDAAVGAIPLLGDAIDFGFKANRRNVELLSQRPTGRATARDWALLVGALVAFAAVVALVVWAIVAIVRAL